MTDIATTDHDAERVSMSDSEGGDEHDAIDSEDDDLAHDAGDDEGGDGRRAKDAENKNITREERLRRSRERNREHARRTRLRKKAQMATRQQRVAELQAESVALRQRIEVRRAPRPLAASSRRAAGAGLLGLPAAAWAGNPLDFDSEVRVFLLR